MMQEERSSVYWLQNDAGAAEFKLSDAAQQQLQHSFTPSGGAAASTSSVSVLLVLGSWVGARRPFPPFLVPNRAPHGSAPKTSYWCCRHAALHTPDDGVQI